MLPLGVLILVAIAYVVWRLWFTAKTKKSILSVLPPENRLSWRVQRNNHTVQTDIVALLPHDRESDNVFEETESRRFKQESVQVREIDLSSWAAATDGLLQALPVVVAFGCVDPAVLKAIEFSTADHVHGLRSVDSYVNDHFFSQADASAEGWLHRLEGYVAEQKAAAVLEHAGHNVVFPEFPNHPDVDFYVDGTPWQIKEGSSAARQVKEFLLQHDGIEVGTGPDVALAIDDPHVHGFPDLDHDTLAGSTKDSLHGVKDGFHAGFHFPIVTFGVSSYREIKLLWKEKTTIETALKNVAVDMAGVGAGAFAGAKAGALAGAWAGPHGAIVGALIGSIAGAIGGKKVANSIRFSAFNKAKDEYLSTVAAAQQAINLRIDHSRTEVQVLRQMFQFEYEEGCTKIVRRAQKKMLTAQEDYQVQLRIFAESFPARLDELNIQLQRDRHDILESIPQSPFRLVFPRRTDILRACIDEWFTNASERVTVAKKDYLALESRRTEVLVAEIRRFLGLYEFELDQLESDIHAVVESFDGARTEVERLQRKAVTEATALRVRLLRELGDKAAIIEMEIGGIVQKWKQDIENYRDTLLREAGPVGIEF